MGEQIIHDALTENRAEFEVEKTFRGFAAPDGQHYTFDFYLPSVEILIECQGHQHFRAGGKSQEELRKFGRTVRRDALKKEWCKKHGYRLICLKSGKAAKAEIDWLLSFCRTSVTVKRRTIVYRLLLRLLRKVFPEVSGVL